MRHPAAPKTAGPDACALGPLDSADAAFRLLTTGPRPLALNPARLARGLPDRTVPLGELKALLLHPATSTKAPNAVLAGFLAAVRSLDPDDLLASRLCWAAWRTGPAFYRRARGRRTASCALRSGPSGDAAESWPRI